MDIELSESSMRLIRSFFEEKSQYEYITAMLWMNLCSDFFPFNTDDNFLYAPEFSRVTGRCDLIISQSNPHLKAPLDAIGIPFLVLEFKAANATADEWAKGIQQMIDTMAYIETYRKKGQWIVGVVAAGAECQFFHRDNGKTESFPDQKLDLNDPSGLALQSLKENLQLIQARTPAKNMHGWPDV